MTKQEEQILQVIQKQYPIAWHELDKVFHVMGKSYDATIKVLDLAIHKGDDFYCCAVKAKDIMDRYNCGIEHINQINQTNK